MNIKKILFLVTLTVLPTMTDAVDNKTRVKHRNYTTKAHKVKTIEVLATKYNPVKAQCNNDPLTTADLSKIHLGKLRRGQLRWIAVSRDLLKDFNYGDTVKVSCENKKLCGEWVIHDTMHQRWTRRIDFLVPTKDKLDFDAPIKVRIMKVIKNKEMLS